MATLHGYPIEVGDRVWSSTRGYVSVRRINSDNYPIVLENGMTYNIDGKWAGDELVPSLFWQPFTIPPEAYEKPEPKRYQVLYFNGDSYQTTGLKYADEDDFYSRCQKGLKFIKLLGVDDD